MTGNAQKTPFARSINRVAEQRVLDAIQTLGKSIPCHVVEIAGSIVTVQFDISGPFTLPNVTCPMVGPEYIRYPTQKGDKGVVVSADYYIGGVSGLGGGVANLTPVANLSALIWLPISNKDWSATDNPNALVLYGPDGAIIRTVDKSSEIDVLKTGVTVRHGSNTLTVDGSNVRTSGVFQAGNGASGSFTSQDGKHITVLNGIVTGIA